jgi:hypothetical protein
MPHATWLISSPPSHFLRNTQRPSDPSRPSTQPCIAVPVILSHTHPLSVLAGPTRLAAALPSSPYPASIQEPKPHRADATSVDHFASFLLSEIHTHASPPSLEPCLRCRPRQWAAESTPRASRLILLCPRGPPRDRPPPVSAGRVTLLRCSVSRMRWWRQCKWIGSQALQASRLSALGLDYNEIKTPLARGAGSGNGARLR